MFLELHQLFWEECKRAMILILLIYFFKSYHSKFSFSQLRVFGLPTQTFSNNSSAAELFECLTILWGWRLKD